jgi:cytochrome P450
MSSDIERATPTPITELELEGLANHARASGTIVHLDDPDHGRVRRLMAEPFRVREVNRLRTLIDERVTAAADRLAATADREGGRLDLVADFTYPLPVEIFSSWLGVPDEDAPQFRTWTGWVARSRDPLPADERIEFFAALDAMQDHLEAQVALRHRSPTDDLLTYLVTAEIDGQRLEHEELMGQLITLYMAGHEPTAGLVGNGVLALLRHPDQLQRLRDHPELLRGALSELLRYDGPNQFVRRITTQPMVLQGTEIPAGAVLYVGLAAANRDPRRWGDTADEVVVDRDDAADHLQFGSGAHACLGAHLARLQAERMLDTVLTRIPDLALAGDPVWSNRMFIRGLQSLPVTGTVVA